MSNLSVKQLIVVGLLALAVAWFGIDWLVKDSEHRGSETDFVRSQAQMQQAQAQKSSAEAAEVQQRVRRQNEQDNGITANGVTRVITGEGITPFELFLGGIFKLCLGIVIIAAGSLATLTVVLYVRWRNRPTTIRTTKTPSAPPISQS